MWRDRIRRESENVSRSFRAVAAVKIKELGRIFFLTNNKRSTHIHAYGKMY